jgi:kynurenine formamidase
MEHAATSEYANGPAVPRGSFDETYRALRDWDRWDEPWRGAYNRVTQAHTARAAALVTSGIVVPTALPWNTRPGPDNAKPALHYMSDLGDVQAPEPSTHKDFIAVDYHGKSVSHLDALSHIAYRRELYGGRRSDEHVDASGAHYGSVASLGPLVTRGVLLDLPVLRGVEWLEPGTAVHVEDILEAEQRHGFTMAEGDAVLLRTGHQSRRRARGAWDSATASAGLHIDAMPLIAQRGIALLGGDGDSDVRPSPVPGVHSPIHILAITALGIPLLDNLDLEALSAACTAVGRREFMLVVAPLNIPTGTGSPVNPLAVL